MHDKTREISRKVQKMNRLLESRYDLDLSPYVYSPEHIGYIEEHYREKYQSIKRVLGENALSFSAEATRAYLISETARMLLREIAPKRINKKRKG